MPLVGMGGWATSFNAAATDRWLRWSYPRLRVAKLRCCVVLPLTLTRGHVQHNRNGELVEKGRGCDAGRGQGVSRIQGRLWCGYPGQRGRGLLQGCPGSEGPWEEGRSTCSRSATTCGARGTGLSRSATNSC